VAERYRRRRGFGGTGLKVHTGRRALEALAVSFLQHHVDEASRIQRKGPREEAPASAGWRPGFLSAEVGPEVLIRIVRGQRWSMLAKAHRREVSVLLVF